MAYTLGPLPWSDDALRKAYFTNFLKAHEAIKEHPGYQAHDAITSLSEAYKLFDEAVTDILTTIADFHREVHEKDLMQRRNKARRESLIFRVRKNVFLAANAAMALVERSRILSRKFPTAGYANRIKAEFAENPQHQFVQFLRGYLFHRRTVGPSWTLMTSKKGQETFFILKLDDLAETYDRSALADQYIAENKKGIDVGLLFTEYRKAVRDFHFWFVAGINERHRGEIMDFLRCEKTLHATGSRAWWKVILQQVIRGKLNPQDFLDRNMTVDELEQMRQLPVGSKQQVDFIIDCLDEYSACDTELRTQVYQAFGIAES